MVGDLRRGKRPFAGSVLFPLLKLHPFFPNLLLGVLQNYSDFCNTLKLANSSCGGTPQSPVRAANA